MAKEKSVFLCNDCGYESPKWAGKCPICGAWNSFVEKVAISKLDGSFLKMITSLEKNDLIILDDFGLQPMDMNTRLALLQILEERYERKSVIIASQLPIAKWYDYIGDATLADAIMDRLVANANKIELKGESMRHRKKK